VAADLTNEFEPSGRLRVLFDIPTRQRIAFDTAGAETSRRPFTVDENAAADAFLATSAQVANAASLTDGLRATIDALIASRATLKASILDPTNATINAGPAPYIKAVAKAVRDDEQTLIRLCRLLGRQLDTTDTGAAVSPP
jgi:hypothetical protein